MRLASNVTFEGQGLRCVVASTCSAQALSLSLGMSRRSAAHAFERGELTLADGAPLSPSAQLKAGDAVSIRLAQPAVATPAAHVAAARVVYHDAVLLAADKPAGQLVHGDGTGAPTLTDAVRTALAERGVRADPQAVQRLDVPTTGLVLFSLTEEFQPALDALVAGHDLHKRYLAEVSGAFPAGARTLDAPIGRDRHDARRMRVCVPGQGKPATTHVELLARDSSRSLVLVELGSGRRHQIRVHLADAGYPIVGDELYGGPRDQRGLMLHALEEEFDHPVTGERLRLRTEWPVRFAAWGECLPRH